MDLVKGIATVFPGPRSSFDPGGIPQAIKDAGFTAVEILLTVDGTLVQGQRFLELNVSGLAPPWVLSGGARLDEFGKRGDLLEKRVQVSGQFVAGNTDRPHRLTVESFQSLP